MIESQTHLLARKIAYETPTAAPAIIRAEARIPALLSGHRLPTGPLATYLNRRWPGIVPAIRANSALGDSGQRVRRDLANGIVRRSGPDASAGYSGGSNFNFFSSKIRFLMDVCFIGMCMSVLDRRGLIFVAFASSILNLILLTYFS